MTIKSLFLWLALFSLFYLITTVECSKPLNVFFIPPSSSREEVITVTPQQLPPPLVDSCYYSLLEHLEGKKELFKTKTVHNLTQWITQHVFNDKLDPSSPTNILIGKSSHLLPHLDFMESSSVIRVLLAESGVVLRPWEVLVDLIITPNSQMDHLISLYLPGTPIISCNEPRFLDRLTQLLSHSKKGIQVSRMFPSLGLNMIVKNEERMIKETIESTLPFIDDWAIIDTGSQDRTVEIITDTFQGEINNHLFHATFQDFSTTRNLAMVYYGNRTAFALHLNGDDRLINGERLKKSTDRFVHFCFEAQKASPQNQNIPVFDQRLGEFHCSGSFLMTVVMASSSYSFKSIRLVSTWNGLGGTINSWHFRHKTHEVISNQQGFPVFSMANYIHVQINDHLTVNDNQTLRNLRDIHLLEKELEEGSPDRTRTMFYLAQTYQKAGFLDQANNLFDQYSIIGTWNDEIVWARLQQTIIAKSQKKIDQLFFYSAEAFRIIPGRIDALPILLDHIWSQSWNNSLDPAVILELRILTFEIARFCSIFPHPNTIGMYLHDSYDQGIPKYLALSAFYISVSIQSSTHWQTGFFFANKLIQQFPNDSSIQTILQLFQNHSDQYSPNWKKDDDDNQITTFLELKRPKFDLLFLITIGDRLETLGAFEWARLVWLLRTHLNFPSYGQFDQSKENKLQISNAFVRMANQHLKKVAKRKEKVPLDYHSEIMSEALNHYQQAIDICPEFGSALYFQGVFLRSLSHFAAAAESLYQAEPIVLNFDQDKFLISWSTQAAVPYSYFRLQNEICITASSARRFLWGVKACDAGLLKYPCELHDFLSNNSITLYHHRKSYDKTFPKAIAHLDETVYAFKRLLEDRSNFDPQPPSLFSNTVYFLTAGKDGDKRNHNNMKDNPFVVLLRPEGMPKLDHLFRLKNIRFHSNWVDLNKKQKIAVINSELDHSNSLPQLRLIIFSIISQSIKVNSLSIPLEMSGWKIDPTTTPIQLSLTDHKLILEFYGFDQKLQMTTFHEISVLFSKFDHYFHDLNVLTDHYYYRTNRF